MRFFYFFKKVIYKILKPFSIFKKPAFKKVFLILGVVFLGLFLIFAPNFIFNKENFTADISNLLSNQTQNKQVLTLWHVETFEGGSANRAKYLERVAQNFNKNQKDCFIIVKTLTEKQLFLNLEQKNYADIYSFGVGSGYMLTSFLDTLDKNENVREDLLNYAKSSQNILAYPYMFGGYVAITRESDLQQSVPNKSQKIKPLGVGLNGFINPIESLIKNNYVNSDNSKFNSEDCIYAVSSYDAYCDFVAHKTKTLIGSSRDFARIKNRENLGNISACNYEYLGGYTDLIQYIGVNKNLSSQKTSLAKNFCNFLTSQQSQQILKSYGLFSTSNSKIYDKSDTLYQFEDVFYGKEISSVNVFENINSLEKLKAQSFTSYFGSKM